MTMAFCPYCGPGVRWYRDDDDPADHRYCGRCGKPIRFRVTLPYSEVCMFVRVAGREMLVEYAGVHAIQPLEDDGRLFSAPITTGEAGVR
jgi:hypothetical protein